MFKRFTLHFLDDLVIIAQQLRRQHFGADIDLTLTSCLNVVCFRINSQRDIRGQCPRGGGPDQEVLVGIGALESSDNGIGLDLLVALSDLVGCQTGTTARTVGQDFMPLVDKALVKEFIQNPPDRFDIVVIQGDVGIFQVDEIAHALAHFTPLFFIAEDGVLTFLIELGDAVGFDFWLAADAQLLFDLDLNRQTVGIPAGFTQYPVSLHGLIFTDRVF